MSSDTEPYARRWQALAVLAASLLVTAGGLKPLTTHVFDAASDYLDSDAVFGVRDSLLVGGGAAEVASAELSAQVDVVLDPADEA